VVIQPIVTVIENIVESIIPEENPIDAITSSTIPLPFIRKAIAKHSSFENLISLEPMYPPPTLESTAVIVSTMKKGSMLTIESILILIPIMAKNIGAKNPKVIAEIIP
jgi:hypothetical protein